MLAIDQEVFLIKVEVSKKMLSVRVLDTSKAIEPRKFGCIVFCKEDAKTAFLKIYNEFLKKSFASFKLRKILRFID